MKILLLFPPSWLPSQPFLSLPALKGFLSREGLEVVQRDLNIEFLEVLLSRQRAEGFYSMMKEALGKGPSPAWMDKYNSLKRAVDYMPLVMEHIEGARDTFRSEKFYDIDRYVEGLGTIDKYLEMLGSFYHPSTIMTYDNNMRYSVYSSQDIMSAIRDERENIFLGIFRRHFLPSIIHFIPNIVGISITSTSQVIPGLTLARLIKRANKDIHVTIGGSIFTKLIDNLLRVDTFFSFVDSFVVFEGEHAILELAYQLSGKGDLSKVPNLIYRDGGVTRINEPFFIEDVNTLPPPDYDGFPFGRYHSPEPVLPLQTSRGCYWGKCAFCNLHYDHKHFRPKDMNLVIRDIYSLKERYNTKYIFFADECLPVKTLKGLSKDLLTSRLDIKWIAGVRFEEGLTREVIRDIRRAGCLKLVFGLESYSQRVLDLMNKGTKREVVRKVIDDCLEEDMAVHVYTIVGFPTETFQEAMDSMNFILDNKRLVSSQGFSFLPCLYGMEIHSPITQDPARYGLRRIMTPKREDLSLGYFYEVGEGMTPEQAEELHTAIVERVNQAVSPFPYNYSMSDGLLYIDRHHSLKEPALR